MERKSKLSVLCVTAVFLCLATHAANAQETTADDRYAEEVHDINWYRVGHCGLAAVGIRDIMEYATGNPKTIQALVRSVSKVSGRALGAIGGAIAVYEFGECMGFWDLEVADPQIEDEERYLLLVEGIEIAQDAAMESGNEEASEFWPEGS